MRAKILSLAALTSLVLFEASCRTGAPIASKELSADAPAKRGVVIVYMGGFNSCGHNTPRELSSIEQFDRVRGKVGAQGVPVRWLISCYNGMGSSYINWMSSADPGTVYGQHWQSPDQAGQIFDEVKALSEDYSWPVYVIGHSYGGWLSSNLVASIANTHPDRSNLVQALFIIDPISPYHCNQATYAATVAKWTTPTSALISRFTAPGGCEQAPWQFTHGDNQTYPGGILNIKDDQISGLIARATSNWQVYYQTRDFLHSSAIAGAFAPRSSFIDFGAFVIGTNSSPHVKIHHDLSIWTSFGSTILDKETNVSGGDTGDGEAGGGGGDFLRLTDGAEPELAPMPSLGPELTPAQAEALTDLAGKDNDPTKVSFAPITPEQEQTLMDIFGDTGGASPKFH